MVKAQYIFFVIGIIFLFTTVAYFSYEFLFNMSNTIKTIVLVCSVIVFFTIAEFMKERGV